MADLSKLYSYTGSSLPLDYMAGANNKTEATSDAKLQQTRLLQLYGERALPEMRDSFAAKGTFYSGTTRRKTDQLTKDTLFDYNMIDRNLSRVLTGLDQNSVLQAAGLAGGL